MAYSAGAYIGTPALPGNPTYLFGNIGTQNDKAMTRWMSSWDW